MSVHRLLLYILPICLPMFTLSQLALAQPAEDRSAVEEKKRQNEEKEKAKANAVVHESESAREQREAQDKKERNAKEAVKRFGDAQQFAAKGQNARALELLQAAALLDPYRHEFPLAVAEVALALKQPETEFKALAAAVILLKRTLAQIGDSPKKPKYEELLKNASNRLAEFHAEGKLPLGTIRLFAEPRTCEIFLDGVYIGVGQGEIESLTGTRKAETRCPGFYDYEQFVNVRVGDPTSATIKPQPVPYFGRLIVKVDPAEGVIIFLDDVPLEQRLAEKATTDGRISGNGTKADPYVLTARKWIIRFAKTGFDRWHRRLDIHRDETVVVDAHLEALAETPDEPPATLPTKQ